jgi:3-oxoacyl-[acyl-carrier protein] reductase
MMILEGKNAVITGCNRGIGKAILTTFVENGANVWACVRQPSDQFESYIKELSMKCRVEIWPVYFDLKDVEQVKLAVRTILSIKKPVHILVNNAGINHTALFQMCTIEKMMEVFHINFYSPMILTQYIIKLMLRSRNGSIINIASSTGIDGDAGRSIYGASKAAMICATKVMSTEFGESGIRVNAIAPGITQTDMLGSLTETVVKNTVQQTHLKRVGDPYEIAKAALFLASDMSSYVTGQILRVDGGLG